MQIQFKKTIINSFQKDKKGPRFPRHLAPTRKWTHSSCISLSRESLLYTPVHPRIPAALIAADDRNSDCGDWCTDCGRGRGGTTATDHRHHQSGCCVMWLQHSRFRFGLNRFPVYLELGSESLLSQDLPRCRWQQGGGTWYVVVAGGGGDGGDGW